MTYNHYNWFTFDICVFAAQQLLTLTEDGVDDSRLHLSSAWGKRSVRLDHVRGQPAASSESSWI